MEISIYLASGILMMLPAAGHDTTQKRADPDFMPYIKPPDIQEIQI